MKAYYTGAGVVIEKEGEYYLFEEDWDAFINNDSIFDDTVARIRGQQPDPSHLKLIESTLKPPIRNQELWASGVTYYKSREARMEESKDAGGGDFYDRVYHAERPELFFKSPPYRVVGHGQKVRIRKDSKWNVPEPELTLCITSGGKIVGYTIGNDMSSRDIEGENPLYLPQAKCYDGSASIGPCIYLTKKPLAEKSGISIEIIRRGKKVFEGKTQIDQIKRKFEELVHYLFIEMSFANGCYLMTGTGIVPPDDFTLDHNDEIRIVIDKIGTLINHVE